MLDFDGKPQQLDIVPKPAQYNRWRINYGGKAIPIGATRVYYPFKDKPQDFIMQGLTGCTAMFAIVRLRRWVIR